uniref:Thyroglobulin type-1 domain-containing protein n=1 Tax=Zonotrichia albicollis TaxID=44394 RepID=A0A8D2N7X2_ZONAL
MSFFCVIFCASKLGTSGGRWSPPVLWGEGMELCKPPTFCFPLSLIWGHHDVLCQALCPQTGSCASAGGTRLAGQNLTVREEELQPELLPESSTERESREHEEPTTSEMTEETYPPKAYRPKHGRLSELKAEALKKDRRKKLTLAKFVGMAENTAHPRVVIPELRQEFELGPCRRHMEASLQELKSSQRMVPRAVHLPNCDRKGFYKRKQCKPSRGRKRGLCWCVDKYGMKLPGTDFLSGDLQCHAFDSSNVE